MKHNLLLSVFFIAQVIQAFAQYDESKVPPYQLPELMVTGAGKKVSTVKEWETQRRPEILTIFAEQVYGKTPTRSVPLRFETTSIDRQALNGTATRKQITVYFTEDKQKYMEVLLYTPNQANGRVPVFLGLNFAGNQTIHADSGIIITKSWVPDWKDPGIVNNHSTEASRGTRARRWPVEEILARGYGLATVYYGDLQPDRSESFNESIHPLFYKKGQTRPAEDEWGAIGAWAWGLSRAMDYLETDRDVDKKRVAVIGHSRLGKAALWAGAQDSRFALVISNDSGEGGAAITRRQYGEQIKRINTSFPHWFAGNYKQYNDREDTLPVDFHQLIALMAPRPVYVASASEDQWADPKGEYLSAYHAGPVYALYGHPTLPTATPPAVETPVGQQTWTGYHMRNGKHDILLYDWDKFMNFADFHFKQ
jgi:hypothetical protein